MGKLIITVATTAAMTTKEHTLYLPTQPEEIAEEVYAAHQAGATVTHVHVRTVDGKATMALDRFEVTVGTILEKCPDHNQHDLVGRSQLHSKSASYPTSN